MNVWHRTTLGHTFAARLFRASLFDSRLYDEVRDDDEATIPAIRLVAALAVWAFIGNGIDVYVAYDHEQYFPPLLRDLVLSVPLWCCWVFLIHLIGTRAFGGQATLGEVFRTQAFAGAPGVLWIVVFVPYVGFMLSVLVDLWGTRTGILAARQGMRLTTVQAVVTVVCGNVSISLAGIAWEQASGVLKF